MGVGLSLRGKLPAAVGLEEWFNSAWEWMSAEFPGMATGAGLGQGPFDPYPRVHVRFHPAADPMKIWFAEESTIHINADSSSVGPGYHLFLCELIWALTKKFDLAWARESADGEKQNAVFFTGDPDEIYKEMFAWLGSMASSALAMSASGGSFNLSMSPSYQFFSEHPLITPMGPRSKEWLQEVARNPQAGADVFPWLEPGITPQFLLNRALTHMWTDVHWCRPVADGDEAVQRTVLNLLREACKLDPSLNYPWAEWLEIMGYLQAEDELTAVVSKHAASAPKTAPIGYRRREVKAILDQGWSIMIPGSFSESATFDPQTMNHTWQYSGDNLVIWFTTYPTYGDQAGNIMPVEEAVLELDELQQNIGNLVDEDTKGKIWRRTFITGDPDRGQAWRFSSILLVPGRLALTHIFSDKKEDLEWALNFFKAIDNSAGASTKYIEQPKFPRTDLVASN